MPIEFIFKYFGVSGLIGYAIGYIYGNSRPNTNPHVAGGIGMIALWALVLVILLLNPDLARVL